VFVGALLHISASESEKYSENRKRAPERFYSL